MDSFAKFGRKNNNNYKNKKKNFKNGNDIKSIYNGKVDLNENKFYNGENKMHGERTFGRRSSPPKDMFNAHNDRLLFQTNQNFNGKNPNSNIGKNIESYSNNIGIKNNDTTDRYINENTKSLGNKKYTKPQQNTKITDNFDKNLNLQNGIPVQNETSNLITVNSREIDIPKVDSKLEPNPKVCDEEKMFNDLNDIQHPLCCSWTFWHTISGNSFRDCLNDVKEFDTVEGFWSIVNHMVVPTLFSVGSDFSLFKSGIKPEWEDKRNENGGSIVITIRNENEHDITNILWRDTLLSLIDGQTYGENFKHICGAVISIRPKLQRIALWVANGKDNITNEDIRKKFISYLKEYSHYSPRISEDLKAHKA